MTGVEPCECVIRFRLDGQRALLSLNCIISCFVVEFRSLFSLLYIVCLTAPCYLLTLTMYWCHCTLYLYLPSPLFGLLLSSLLLSFSPPSVFLSSSPSTMLSSQFRDLEMASTRTRIIIMLTNVLLRFFLPSAFVSICLLPNDKESPCTSSSSCHRVERRKSVTTRRCVG